MKKFDTQDMAHGGLSLVLEAESSWAEFRKYAEYWASKLDAEKLSGAVVTVDECLLEVQVRGGRFWITYDDFQSSIQLEPQDKKHSDIVLALQAELRGIT
jgi:hypothetical protein